MVKQEEKRKWWQWLIALPLAGLASFFQGPKVVALLLAAAAIIAIVALIGGRRLVCRVKEIAAEARA